VPQWTAGSGHGPDTPPVSPVPTSEPLEELELVPFGSTNVRISVFPTAKPLIPAPYAPGGTIIPATAQDVLATMPAAVQDNNGKDKGYMALRSGEPKQLSQAWLVTPVAGPGHRIAGMRLSYRYVTGYNKDNGKTGVGANFTVSLSSDGGRPGEASDVIYKSPEIKDHSFDTCKPLGEISCYSPPVEVEVASLDLSAESPRFVNIAFQSHDHTIQLLLPLNITILWRHDVVV